MGVQRFKPSWQGLQRKDWGWKERARTAEQGQGSREAPTEPKGEQEPREVYSYSVILMPYDDWQLGMADRHASEIRGLPVIIPDGRLLGTVHDTVVDVNSWSCTHIFVSDPPESLVEGRTHVAVPWNWVKSVGDVVFLLWFPQTPIPLKL